MEYTANNDNINDLCNQIEKNTPSWHQKQVLTSIRNNLRPVKHPYFQNYYETLRLTSLAILREEGASFYDSFQEAEGIIFDGSWLWEEYLATVLADDYEHCRYNENGLKVFKENNYKLYPDFLHRNNWTVFDAKYKHKADRAEDIHQILSYLCLTGAGIGGLIYPKEVNVTDKDGQKIENVKSKRQ
ncbi:MAG: hypothetical protein WCR46_15165 [Deltaproteobacteria bacterium]